MKIRKHKFKMKFNILWLRRMENSERFNLLVSLLMPKLSFCYFSLSSRAYGFITAIAWLAGLANFWQRFQMLFIIGFLVIKLESMMMKALQLQSFFLRSWRQKYLSK